MILFIIKSAITLALLYSVFFLFLSKETFHRFNRLMLIGIMIAAFVVPMFHITTEHPTIINQEVQQMEQLMQEEIIVIYEDEASDMQPQITWVQALKWVYVAGVAVMLIITLIQVINLIRLMRGGVRQKDEMGNTIILIHGDSTTFLGMLETFVRNDLQPTYDTLMLCSGFTILMAKFPLMSVTALA